MDAPGVADVPFVVDIDDTPFALDPVEVELGIKAENRDDRRRRARRGNIDTDAVRRVRIYTLWTLGGLTQTLL